MHYVLLVVIVAASACSGGTAGGHETSRAVHFDLPDLSSASIDVTTPFAAEPPRENTPAPSPREAVERFVRAAVASDSDTSYDLLSSPDRDAVKTRSAWKRDQASLPSIVSFLPNPYQDPPSRTDATIVGDAHFEPRIDELNGLVAAHASVSWKVVAEEGGWRVAFQRTTTSPIYPSDQGATESARAWLDAYQRCGKPDARLEYAEGLVGSVGVAALLCNTATAKLEAPKRLGDRPDPSPVLAAFGPEADTWARVIRVTGPRTFNLVLAPLADQWIVIGVLTDGS